MQEAASNAASFIWRDRQFPEKLNMLTPVPDGGFAYLPGSGRTFSQGVVASAGYVFHRVNLLAPLAIEDGLKFAAEFICSAGCPLLALCGCELRIPQQLTRLAFSEFNRRYVAGLGLNGFCTDPVSPAARTNMAPADLPPAEAVLTAFTFAVPGSPQQSGTDFVVSGRPELASSSDRVIAPGDLSASGMQVKATFVLQELQHTVKQLGGHWSRITAARIYTRHSLAPIANVLASSGLSPALWTHIPGDPPVVGADGIPLEFEADVRSVTVEETA